jgi:phosphoglycolate phosphatase-like HAD superfamily hydrolase
MKKIIRHVCFDKDGTLIDVHAYWADIVERRALEIGRVFHVSGAGLRDLALAMGVDLSAKRIILGGPVGYKPRTLVIQGALDALRKAGVHAAAQHLEDIFCAIDRRLQQDGGYVIKALPHVRETLRRFQQNGIKISVYSSDRKEHLSRIFRAMGVENHFDAAVGGDEVHCPKPHPEGFLLACERTGIDVSHAVYVGDTLDDMKMARLARSAGGWGVTTGLCPREALLTQTEHVFSHLGEVGEFLSNGNN